MYSLYISFIHMCTMSRCARWADVGQLMIHALCERPIYIYIYNFISANSNYVMHTCISYMCMCMLMWVHKA